MEKKSKSDVFSSAKNPWGWQFMQAEGVSVSEMNNRKTKKTGYLAPILSIPPPPKQSVSKQPSMFGNLMATVGQGVAFGTGSGIAHKTLDTPVFIPSNATDAELIKEIRKSCNYFKLYYENCMQTNRAECEKINSQYLDCLDTLKKYDAA